MRGEYIYGNYLYNRKVLRAFLLYKNPPGDHTAAYNENVAGATAAGEEFRKRNYILNLRFPITSHNIKNKVPPKIEPNDIRVNNGESSLARAIFTMR